MKDLSLHILDIVQNSIRAGARNVGIDIREDTRANTYGITIKDDGCGMDAEAVKRVTDPYFTSRTSRHVGLGIPLFLQNAQQTGGDLQIESVPGKGTRIKAVFVHDNIDRPPLGDMPGVLMMLIGSNPAIEFSYRHSKNGQEYLFDTREVKEALDGMSLEEYQVRKYLKEMIQENLQELNAL